MVLKILLFVLAFFASGNVQAEIPVVNKDIGAWTGQHDAPVGYRNLLRYIEQQSEQVKIAFAQIALEQMSLEHQELLQANYNKYSGQRMSRSESAKTYRWQNGLIQQLEQINGHINSLHAGAELKIVADNPGGILLIIGKIPIIVNPVDISSMGRFHHQIQQKYCAIYMCVTSTASGEEFFDAEDNAWEMLNTGVWELLENGQMKFYTDDGVGFIFRSVRNREGKKRDCLRILNELKHIASELKRLYQDGYIGDINAVKLYYGGRGQVRAKLRNQSMIVLAEAPMLSQLTSIQEKILPWIRARINDEQYFLDVDYSEISPSYR